MGHPPDWANWRPEPLPSNGVDQQKRQALIDAGISVVVFTQDTTSWPEVLSEYSWLFGEGKS